ncbi:MAG: DNA/RNA nuclease SfsA [Alphaproteobacteria bacterium]|nr:MAG: DNA/RNA nuclease SfsA [Alphaproteobacteria bacterium]
MRYDPPLIPGTLIKRYKRFLVDVQLDTGEVIVCHCPNSGAMLGINTPGLRVWVQPIVNPTGKLGYRFEMVEVQNTYVGANTARPNKLVEEALRLRTLVPFGGYECVTREVKYGAHSRMDFLLSGPNLPNHYVEVKNVHHKVADQARFPDSVTVRGTKHLRELMACVKEGGRASVVFVIQRDDCVSFAPAAEIDTTFAQAFREACAAGVDMYAYLCTVCPISLEILREIPIIKDN